MSLPIQEEEATPLASKKAKVWSTMKRPRIGRLQKKFILIPLVPKTIPEIEDEEDEEENLPLS